MSPTRLAPGPRRDQKPRSQQLPGRLVRRTFTGAIGAVLAVSLAACGTSTFPGANLGTKDDAGPGKALVRQQLDPKLAAMVPADVRKRGTLRVATDASYAPFEFIGDDGSSIEGFDPDVGQAIGELLGLRTGFSQVAFDGLVPALQSGRFDLVMAGMNDTVERQRSVDFIDYFQVHQLGMLVPKGNPDGIKQISDLCGRTVAAQKGTAQLDWVRRKSRECGSRPMRISALPAEADVQLQVRTRRAAADVTDYPVAVYTARTSGGAGFDILPTPFQHSLHGIAVDKSQRQLREAVRAALQRLMDNGGYRHLLARYGIEKVALSRATVNEGTE